MTEAPLASAPSAGRRKPGRRPMPDAQRRDLLRDAAATIFLRDGYAAASMEDVARLAGMSKRTLYRIFPSKADLFEDTIGSVLAPLRIDSALEETPELGAALGAILEATGRHLLAQRQTALFRLVIAEGPRCPELAERWHRALVSRGASSLERRLAAEMRAARLRLTDARLAARMLYGMALGAAQIRLLLGVAPPPCEAELRAMIQAAVSVFLDGARVPQEACGH
ncbi:MAG TPA: TetR/AcrR family transcriptional regulator [Roseococcus sp.]|nr:TetR/AcrR family transcriptional regulator [Roseococcus sp.]